MATQTRTPTSAGGLLGLFVALVVGAGVLYGFVKKGTGGGDDERAAVTFTVTFEPTERVSFVDILITMGGNATPLEQTRKSPWSKTIQARKGELIILTASQVVPATLSCAVNGQVQETTTFPGTVTCTHKRV